MEAIHLNNVSFSINNYHILKNINLSVKKGVIYGFLGPNGAGKTTLMKTLLNLIHPNEGTIRVLGRNVTLNSYEHLKYIGSIIETPVFYNNLSVDENLKLYCSYMEITDLKKITESLKLVKLEQARNKKVKELSLGMKQRLAIARALIAEPQLLILDEPINGLDPFGIQEIRELLLHINKEKGITIFISSHIITEIESICDVIGFINHGKMIKEMTISDIKNQSKKYIEVKVDNPDLCINVLNDELSLSDFAFSDTNTIRIYDPSLTQKKLMHTLISNDIEIDSINEKSGNLEEFFMKLMKEGGGNV